MTNRWLLKTFTLSQVFFLLSFIVLLGGMIIIGGWVSSRIQDAVIQHASSLTSLYVNTFIPPLLDDISEGTSIDEVHQHVLDHLLSNTQLTEEIITLRVWMRDRTLLYSTDLDGLGSREELQPELQEALDGHVVWRLVFEPVVGGSETTPHLIRIYAPVFDAETGNIQAVVETFQDASPLLEGVQQAQQQSWIVVGAATLTMYLILAGFVHQASKVISSQQDQLRKSVSDLQQLLGENQQLHGRLQTAATRTSEINEQFLHRIGRDLHDGPAQDIALVLLQVDDLCTGDPVRTTGIKQALQSALYEIRTIAAGLQLPELSAYDTAQVIRRAVRAFQQKTAVEIPFDLADPLLELSQPGKIALYRAVTEALFNAYRHAEARDLCGEARMKNGRVMVTINDGGPGFDPGTLDPQQSDHLGLVGLQERIALLSGQFEVRSKPGKGTRVIIELPTGDE